MTRASWCVARGRSSAASCGEDFAFVVRDGSIAARGRLSRRARPGARPRRALVSRTTACRSGLHQRAQSRVSDSSCADGPTIWPFAKWRSDALYRVVPQLTPDDVYWIFVAAFAEMLAAGITTVAEFFYLNGGGNAHAEAAIRAARDTGIRLVLARTWMDADYAPPEFRESDRRRRRANARADASAIPRRTSALRRIRCTPRRRR